MRKSIDRRFQQISSNFFSFLPVVFAPSRNRRPPHPPTSFRFPRDLLTHVETSLFKRKNSIFYYMPTAVAHITRQQQHSLFTYDHRPFQASLLCMRGWLANMRKQESLGERKMFYFSFDNKEEMFIRSNLVGRGRSWRYTIHY